MANHKSAEKRARQTVVRTERNRARKAKIRTLTKKADAAIATGDKTATVETVKQASRMLQRAGTTGTMHKNTAARRISRLAKKANATPTATAAPAAKAAKAKTTTSRAKKSA